MLNELKGWFKSGLNPLNYDIGIDKNSIYAGEKSAYLKSKTQVSDEEFGIMMKEFDAKKYIGQRMKLSGFIKTQNVQHSAALWMLISDSDGDTLQFDNMSDRPLIGTKDWANYSIVLDVPKGSSKISFGLLLQGNGQMWVNQLSFYPVVDKREKSTNLHPTLPTEPANLSFEEEI
ncbi:hypothetical protein [Pseudobacillus badius]|uniref:hypothetical protein n=1 Tax=Bacillus badius TaxID=1455 RepID=UPI003D330A36